MDLIHILKGYYWKVAILIKMHEVQLVGRYSYTTKKNLLAHCQMERGKRRRKRKNWVYGGVWG